MYIFRRLGKPIPFACFLAFLGSLNWLLFYGRVRTSSQRHLSLCSQRFSQDLSLSVRPSTSPSQLHLLVPTTSSNKYFCQLLLSALVLKYPSPVLINWETIEKEDEPKQYAGKVDAVLGYLKSFPSEKDDDLVLIIDGHDVWFQLPPDVVIRRYFEIVASQNRRLASRFGSSVAKQQDIRQTVIFGADKYCKPGDGGRHFACLAPPQSTMPKNAFGPYPDVQLNDARSHPYQARPRWLNPGTIIGPVADLRAFFEATSSWVHNEPKNDSHQWYYAEMFGVQEYGRSLLDPATKFPPENVTLPQLAPGQRTEFHVGLDYESAIFQDIGYYIPYLSWQQHGRVPKAGWSRGIATTGHRRSYLSDDISRTSSALSALEPFKHTATNDGKTLSNGAISNTILKDWQHMSLATNIITKRVFALMHFAIDKDYRDKWWERMWFYPWGKDLLRASAKVTNTPLSEKPIGGRMWFNAQAPVIPNAQGTNEGRRDGAWSDKGQWLRWNGLCEAHGEALFGNQVGSGLTITDPGA